MHCLENLLVGVRNFLPFGCQQGIELAKFGLRVGFLELCALLVAKQLQGSWNRVNAPQIWRLSFYSIGTYDFAAATGISQVRIRGSCKTVPIGRLMISTPTGSNVMVLKAAALPLTEM